MNRLRVLHPAALLLAAGIAVASCSKDDDPPTSPAPQTSSLTIIDATPASGNGTLGGITAVLEDVPAPVEALGGTGNRQIRIRATTAGREHQIVVEFVPEAANATLHDIAIERVTHTWAADLEAMPPAPDAVTYCVSAMPPCGAAYVSINQEARRVTFVHVTLFDSMGGGNTSGIHGVVYY
jgi:hypothetical protein